MQLTKEYLRKKEAQFRIKQGALLEASRRTKGISQQKAGDSIGVSHDVISNFEIGKTNVSPYRLLKLAQLYNKPISYFYNVGAL